MGIQIYLSEERLVALFIVLSFLITFVCTRVYTRLARTRNWGSGHAGGIHVHHMVVGIVFVLVSGWAALALDPGTPWTYVLGIFFGAGAALTLDEFALWLHLKDVYWAQEGRASIDAVIIAAGLFGLSVVGYPFWHGVWAHVVQIDDVSLAGMHAAGLVLGLICLTKGKAYEGVVGAFVPPVGLIGVCRLATPGSLWARRFYGPGKMARSTARYGAPQRARGLARDVEIAFERPSANWRGLVRWGVVLAVAALVVVDAVLRAPVISDFAILALVLVAVLLESTSVRHRAAKRAPAPALPPSAPAETPGPAAPAEVVLRRDADPPPS